MFNAIFLAFYCGDLTRPALRRIPHVMAAGQFKIEITPVRKNLNFFFNLTHTEECFLLFYFAFFSRRKQQVALETIVTLRVAAFKSMLTVVSTTSLTIFFINV